MLSLFPNIQRRSETQGKSSLCFPYLPTFSAGSKRSKVFASPSLHLVLALNVGKVFACLLYFPTFSAGSKRRESLRPAFPISLHLVLALNVGKSSRCFPYFATFSTGFKRKESLRPAFPTFSADSKCRESLRPAFPISLHLVLTLNRGKVFALPSLFPYIQCWLYMQGKSSPCFPYFPTFSAGSTCSESLRLAFPISLHFVLSLNVRKVFALPSLFLYIQCWL